MPSGYSPKVLTFNVMDVIPSFITKSKNRVKVCGEVLRFIPSGNPLEISISHLLENSAELPVGIKVREREKN